MTGMASRIILSGQNALVPRRERATFLSPMSPEDAGAKLDLAINGERKPFHTTLARSKGHFDGNVQVPYFWVAAKGSALNPMERRLEGMLVPNAGSTEVRVELRMRSVAVGSMLAIAATLITLTIVVIGIVLAAGVIDGSFGAVVAALFFSAVAAMWVLFAGGIWVGKRLAKAGEEQTVEFVTTVLDAPSIQLD
jgi:hypothetical protein